MPPGAVSMQAGFDPQSAMLRHGAYLFMTHEIAPRERDVVQISYR